jgi:hypothetical protein
MTAAQKFKFYFPAWTACVRANSWRKERGRLVGHNLQPATGNLQPELAKVFTFATQRALQAGRSLAVDDLRHGCHLVALGRDKSSADLTNAEVDKVVTLFHLLANPDDLDARLGWDAYARGEDPGAVRRLEWFIVKSAPEAYIRSVSADKFGTRQWEQLTLPQKKHLAMTLANRRTVKIAAAATPQPTPENCPF